MELFYAAKHGDLAKLESLLLTKSGDINFENSNFATVDEARPKKSVFCAECYQRIKRRDRSFFRFTTFGCDWPSHQRSSVISDPSVDACSCKTPHAEDCNWLVCVDCFTQSTYGLKAPHQTYNLQEGFTPLIAAASAGHIECVQKLLECGAEIDKEDENGLTALLLAASAERTDIVKLLLERGANINHVDNKSGLSALAMACIVGDVATVEVLLGFNPDLSVRETGGATLLHAAASAGHVGIMQVLLDRGLNPNETDSMGDTPLHWIPSNGSAAAVRLLLDRGADMNAQNSMQYTPILLATLRDNYVGVTTLLSAGARADIDTASWGTPLEASCLGNFPRCTEALLSAGITATYSW
eukprot:gene24627-27848_t